MYCTVKSARDYRLSVLLSFLFNFVRWSCNVFDMIDGVTLISTLLLTYLLIIYLLKRTVFIMKTMER